MLQIWGLLSGFFLYCIITRAYLTTNTYTFRLNNLTLRRLAIIRKHVDGPLPFVGRGPL